MKITEVAAAIIRNSEGKILICRRGDGGNCAFLWEFPGGKRESGESMAECLVRECQEELGVDLEIVKLYAELVYSYPDKTIRFNFFDAKILRGEVKMNVHREMKWADARALPEYEFCPADVRIVKALAQEA